MRSVPEIGEDLPDVNPLLRKDGLPEFNSLSIEKCVAVLGKQALDAEKCINNIEQTLSKPDNVQIDAFTDILNPIENVSAQLETTWGLAKTLYMGNSSVMPTKSYMSMHERARNASIAKFNSPIITKALKQRRTDDQSLSEQNKRLLDKYLLESKLNGVELSEKDLSILQETMNQLQQEKTKFKDKLDISIKRFSHTITDYNLVREFPMEFLQSIAADPLNPSKGPWQIGLHENCYQNFMEHCQDRKLRWNVWQANIIKASGFTERLLMTSVHIEEIRFLRKSQAKILGFPSFAEMSMKTKMAGSVENIQTMIGNLLASARGAQERELADLQAFAEKNGFNARLEPYDIPYWRRKALRGIHNFDEELIREYFPLPKVLSGLFGIVETLFGIKIHERTDNVNTWHQDVKFYDIFNASNSEEPIAGFYLDLYSRENTKITHQGTAGWHIGIRNRCVQSKLCPLSALIFNFPIPLYGKPSLLPISDVRKLFTNFGRALQHLLTEVEHNEIAGCSNIEWDAVEICGNVLVHILHHPMTIKSISGHYTNDEQLPNTLIDAIQVQRQHFAGLDLSHELYLSAVDLELYTNNQFWGDIVKELWPQFMSLPMDKKDSHLCSFAAIMSGEWAAAYYSHIWSRLLAADVYSAFHEVGTNLTEVQAVGKRFRETFLALGGGCHPSEVFRRFRGRDPSPNALLKSLGLTKQTTSDVSGGVAAAAAAVAGTIGGVGGAKSHDIK